MVLLSAQDSDANINSIAPELYKVYPNINTLALTNVETLQNYTNKLRNYRTKTKWLIENAQPKKRIKIFQQI